MNKQLKILTGIIVITLISLGVFAYGRQNKIKESNLENSSSAQEKLVKPQDNKFVRKPTIVTSFYPVEFLVKGIVGDDYNIETIVPKDKTPHSYNLTDQDLTKITNSDLYVYMGGSIDEFPQNPITKLDYGINYSLDMVIPLDQNPLLGQKAPENKIQNRIQIKKIGDSNLFDNIKVDAHSADYGNPHTWLDPKRMLIYADNVSKKLSETFPMDKELFETNAKVLKSKLQEIDQKYTTGLGECKLNYVMTSDDSIGQLAISYKFKSIVIDEQEPSDQISFQKYNQTLATIKADELKYIFSSSNNVPNSIETLVKKYSVKVLNFDTMETIEGDQYYFSIMEKNLKNLELARICG